MKRVELTVKLKFEDGSELEKTESFLVAENPDDAAARTIIYSGDTIGDFFKSPEAKHVFKAHEETQR